MYVFTWESPIKSYMMSYHTAEIPFVFNNINFSKNMTGDGKEAHNLADKMSQAWINFAKTGNPNGNGLPKWEPYNREKGATMIFDNVIELKYNHDLELMKLLVPNYDI